MDVRGAKIASAVALFALIGALAAPAAHSRQANTRVVLTSLESGVLADLNQIRAQHGLKPLGISARLTAAAAQHSREMGADGYFQHESHDGTAFWKRIGRYYGSTGYGYWSVGENLLWSSPQVDASGALNLWMNSPEHRKNILTPRWREIGISALHFASAPGTYKGLEVTIITTDFGVRH
ncbi:MAG: CAP domain-containing protein [Thermoleophilia bacterium]|nr:CAP domain-containing protein [Thermoleophilia bacterium]